MKRVRKKPFSKQIRRLARLPKRIINSGSFSVLLIISIILIAGAGYYVYLFDPNTVTLMDGNTYYSNSTGYQMKIHNNPTSHNPTYQELINFVVNDNTDKIHYTPGSFVCIDYSVKLHDNAEKANITAGVALYKFSNNVDGHACDVFNTTDRGMVYIDCTGGYTGESMPNWDKEVIKPSIGSLYTVQPVTPIGNYYYPQENWMISESIIFW